MLEVELDIFSGMPNPTWTLTPQEESELVDLVRAAPEQISPVATEDEKFGLGYRGFIIRFVKENDGEWERFTSASEYPLPVEFRVGSKPTRSDVSVTEWLLATSVRRYGLDDELREVIAEGVALLEPPPPEGPFPPQENSGSTLPVEEPPAGAEETEEQRGYTWHRPCRSAHYRPNADLFNRPQWIHNTNCYCFACSYPGGRWAKPGAWGGKPAASMTVDDIRGGLYVDGWADNCQTKTLTIAAVVWPGQDFHFYRLVSGDPYWVWGHKPGGTPAVHHDNCGYPIRRTPHYLGTVWQHPANCCRGRYTDFGGWFYQNIDTAFCK
jgi:hypothetical protein